MTQRLPPSLTPLDAALAALLRDVAPVEPVQLPPTEAAGCIAAATRLAAFPRRDLAATDGWALRAADLVGASAYSPVPLAMAPVWVETGDVMPSGCDCVLDADALDASAPIVHVLAEGVPGQGIKRAGSDGDEHKLVVIEGRPIGASALWLARMSALATLSVRRPRLRIVNVPGATATAHMIAELARDAGLDPVAQHAEARDASSIAAALDGAACDLLLTIGGSGVGSNDAAATALAARGGLIAHGLALQPGRTAAIGRLGRFPVIALPGSPDHALAAWLALAMPLADRLAGRQPRRPVTLPLARKIASSVGMTEIALLAREQHAWMPLALGEWPLHAMARADAWLLIPASDEGFAAGTPVDAYLMRDT